MDKEKYNGTLLIQRDKTVLNELEKIIGEPLPLVSEIEFETFGFKIEGEKVTGLACF